MRLNSELDEADQRAGLVAGQLRLDQLNWQPGPGIWSIGQCLDHLIVTNGVYAPPIARALEGREQERRRVAEIRLGWFGRWFIRNYVAPNPGGAKTKAPRKIDVASSVGADVLAKFVESNRAVRALIRQASDYDVNAIRFKNPLVGLFRFPVGMGLEIIAKHESRHLLQAEGVRKAAGFPL
jgi:hypothetical protein